MKFVHLLFTTVHSQLALTGTCGAGCGLHHLRGHEVDLGVVGGLDTTFNPQHLSNRVLVPMADFKFFPGLPEISSHLKIIIIINKSKGNACAILNEMKLTVNLTLGSQIWEQKE